MHFSNLATFMGRLFQATYPANSGLDRYEYMRYSFYVAGGCWVCIEIKQWFFANATTIFKAYSKFIFIYIWVIICNSDYFDAAVIKSNARSLN